MMLSAHVDLRATFMIAYVAEPASRRAIEGALASIPGSADGLELLKRSGWPPGLKIVSPKNAVLR